MVYYVFVIMMPLFLEQAMLNLESVQHPALHMNYIMEDICEVGLTILLKLRLREKFIYIKELNVHIQFDSLLLDVHIQFDSL